MTEKTIIQSFAEDAIRASYASLAPHLNERSVRIWAATEVKRYGRGGISAVHRATNLDFKTIRRGIKDLETEDTSITQGQIRRKGGGRKSLAQCKPEISAALSRMLEDATRGDPESLLLWTNKSTYTIQKALKLEGYDVSQTSIYKILIAKDYSLQANKKKLEGSQHADRDAQFTHINERGHSFQKQGCPVLSVDTKKKENIGHYKNGGREYSPQGTPVAVQTHDFPNKTLGKVAPYGIYDVGRNEGWVSVGISADTAAFAVNSIRTWWYAMGQDRYKDAHTIMITADCGGSNSYRARLWKWQLQALATEIGKAFCVCHFPPGTSKWNKIEHKMFSYISTNWRARPLLTYETVVNLIANTRTKAGLTIQAALDRNTYETGIEVSDADFQSIHIQPDAFHGEWNYTIHPQEKKS